MLIPRNEFEWAIFVLHTHSDDNTGDLFYTSCDAEKKTALSTGIEDVSFPFKTPWSRFIDKS
jgi:hypothetical protein